MNSSSLLTQVADADWAAVAKLRHLLLSMDLARLSGEVTMESLASLFFGKELINHLWENFGTDASFQIAAEGEPGIKTAAQATSQVLLAGLKGEASIEVIEEAVQSYFVAVREREERVQAARAGRRKLHGGENRS